MHGSARQTSPQSMTAAIAPSAMSTCRRWRSPCARTSSPDEGGSASAEARMRSTTSGGLQSLSSRRYARFSRARGTRTDMSARRLKSTGNVVLRIDEQHASRGRARARSNGPLAEGRMRIRSSSVRDVLRPARPHARADSARERPRESLARESRRGSGSGTLTGTRGATRGRIASSRSTPGIAIWRRGNRNVHSSSTIQTELSQPCPRKRSERLASSGNWSSRSARTSGSSIATSASHSGIAPP